MSDSATPGGRSEKEIFFEALEKHTPQERAAFLDGACGTNPVQRAKVEVLLAHHFQQDSFMKEPAADASAATLPSPPPSELPAQMLGRYKLLEKIGEGGFGQVWMAEQREPVKRRVALKIIKLGMDSRQVVARFEAERQALAMMDHSNIAKIFDADVTDTGRPYFVMELVRGIKITDYCDQNQLPTQERLRLFILVCQAIQHAHQKGIIHRDIKPSNILVTLHDGVAVPKVIDFGIAKATQQELTDKTVFTQFQQFIGTPAYISPEQAEMSGLDIDTRADIYSLGVLLYELLVGQTPFDAREMVKGGLDALRRIIREKEPLRPSTKLNTLQDDDRTTAGKRRQTDVGKLVHQLQGDLDWIVMKCLEKDRTRRYDTANGLASDIQRHLNDEAVLARPPSAAYRFQKLVRRNKLAFAAVTSVAAVLVIGIVVSTWQAIRATRAEHEQSHQREIAVKASASEAVQRNVAEALSRKASESQQQSRRLLYAADMNLAQQALKLNNLGRARRLLDRHRPQPGEDDLRGWEWRYLWQLTRSSALDTLTNRPAVGSSVSFSPDGSRLAMGWNDGHVELWDVPGRRRVRALTDEEQPHSGCVAFSPVRNLLAATSAPKVVSLYDLDSGRESILWRAPEQGAWDVRDLAFSQDGSRVVIYAGESSGELEDSVSVVNLLSSRIEGPFTTDHSLLSQFGAARLSPDNQRLYLARSHFFRSRYSIQCLDLATGQKLWETEAQPDQGLTTLALSPDGRLLASGSGNEDPTIRIWDAANGRLLLRLKGHTGWVSELVFTRDGRRLISAATDQTIRFWDTSNWTEIQVLRGHTDQVRALAISERAQILASAGKEGDVLLWKDDGKSATDGYRRFPSHLWGDCQTLDHSRLLSRRLGQPPELIDLQDESSVLSLAKIESFADVLGWFGTNILCQWNGTNQILVLELRGKEFFQRGAVTVKSDARPSGVAYNATRQLLAWAEGTTSASVSLAGLGAPERRFELKDDVPGLVPFRFSEDGNYLAASIGKFHRVWNVDSGQVVASISEQVEKLAFAAGGRVLVVAIRRGIGHEIDFYDLAHPDRAPQRVPGRNYASSLAVSPDGGLVASSTGDGLVRLFDPATGKLIDSLHGHLGAVFDIAFSPDGRRLISTAGGPETVKLWDMGTRQELLTLGGAGAMLSDASWSADGNVIFARPPWQAWRAPSWEEIAAAEAKEKMASRKP